MSLAHQLVFDSLQPDITCSRVIARQLSRFDVIPKKLDIGFDLLGRLDPEWIWVLDRGGMVEGCVVAAPCHGIAFIWRVATLPGTSGASLLRLLRKSMRDMRLRNITGFITFLDPEQEKQQHLGEVILRLGGKALPPLHLMAAFPMPKEGV